MLFHKHKIVFVGIPKNASHGILAGLANKTDRHHDHTTYMNIYHDNDEELLDTYTSLAVVRNPYERAYSCWNYLTQIEELERKFNISNFEEYVHALESKNRFNCEMTHENLVDHELTFPQHRFIAFKNIILVDKILRQETLDADWDEFVKEYNKTSQFKIKTTLKKHNSMEYKEPDWTKVYTPEMYSIINEYYKKDFELFNYEMITK
jgi:hypothetical protein